MCVCVCVCACARVRVCAHEVCVCACVCVQMRCACVMCCLLYGAGQSTNCYIWLPRQSCQEVWEAQCKPLCHWLGSILPQSCGSNSQIVHSKWLGVHSSHPNGHTSMATLLRPHPIPLLPCCYSSFHLVVIIQLWWMNLQGVPLLVGMVLPPRQGSGGHFLTYLQTILCLWWSSKKSSDQRKLFGAHSKAPPSSVVKALY